MSDSSASPLSVNVLNRRRLLQAGGLAAISSLACFASVPSSGWGPHLLEARLRRGPVRSLLALRRNRLD